MNRSRVPRFLKADRGVSAVEFALIFPILMLVFFLLVDFGRIMFVQLAVEAASNEGVRTSALYPNVEHCVSNSLPGIYHPDCPGMKYSQEINNEVKSVAKLGAVSAANISTLGTAPNVEVTVVHVCSLQNNKQFTEVKVFVNFDFLLPITLGQMDNFVISASGYMKCLG